jgi:hypothetical protein
MRTAPDAQTQARINKYAAFLNQMLFILSNFSSLKPQKT